MLLTTVKIVAKPGQIKKMVELLKEISSKARKEDGVLVYEPYQSVEASDTVYMHEVYRDQAALDKHRANMGAYHDKLMALVDGNPDLHMWVPAAV